MSDTHLTDLRNDLHEISLACIHCGLCLPECPTYVTLQNEMDSPRGRIYLMRAMAAGELEASDPVTRHLDLCLGCLGCESVCPSNVRYGTLLERTRERIADGGVRPPSRWDARLVDWLVFQVLPYPRRMRAALRMGRIANALGLLPLLRGSRLLRRVSPRIAQALELLPVDAAGVAAVSPGEVAPRGEQRAAVLFFTGCATSTLTPATVGHALAVLSHNGCAVRCPTAQTCCGAIHYHAGRRFEARELARANIDAFDGDGPVVNIAAGCGAMMKHYPDLLSDDPHYADRARRFVARVRDIAEFLIEFGPRRPERSLAKDIASGGSPPMRVTYHDACHHAHAQGIRRQPRELLRMIPGVELVECESSDLCCGAAGSYNLTQPRVAAELGRRKLDTLLAGGASVVATGNVGCILHLQAVARRAGVDLRVAHTIDLLSEAYGDADAAG